MNGTTERKDLNEKFKIADFMLAGKRYMVYLLNPGDVFDGFGGSRSGLLVRKTASLVVREESPMGTYDTEYGINNKDVWRNIFRCAYAADFGRTPGG